MRFESFDHSPSPPVPAIVGIGAGAFWAAAAVVVAGAGAMGKILSLPAALAIFSHVISDGLPTLGTATAVVFVLLIVAVIGLALRIGGPGHDFNITFEDYFRNPS